MNGRDGTDLHTQHTLLVYVSRASVYLVRMKVREIIQALEADGWQDVRANGGHRQFKHPTKPGQVTVPFHRGDLPPGTLRSIEKQAGIKIGA